MRTRQLPISPVANMSSQSESEEEKEVLETDAAFLKAHRYMEKVQSILEKESHRVKQEKESFESVAKKLKHVHFSSTVKLNVGGQIFTTSLETLKKDAGSMLNAMFSGRFDTKPAEDGSYFIDRDGTCFRYILNYLRTGKLILPEDKVLKKEVLEEASFYQIQGIIEKLKPKPYMESAILSQEWRDWLEEAVGTTYDEYKLVYRASKNGWASTNFHTCCDNKGPTLVVVKSSNYIFGGYTEEPWDCAGVYKRDDAAFLFSLVNPAGLPTKMKGIQENMTNAILCNSSYGPTFGGGNDLRIASNPNSTTCSYAIGTTYECPTGQSATTFLTGSQNFTVGEIEVFEHVMLG